MSVFSIVIAVFCALIVILALVLLAGALRLKPTPYKNAIKASGAQGTDESLLRFTEMLKCSTVWGAENPNIDRTAFDEFIPLLKKLYPLVFEKLEFTCVNTYGIMLRWKGADSTLAPVVLMAHYDVVEAKSEEWTYPPFAAQIVDGRIYARGAVDTKCVLAGLLEAISTLLSEGHTPPRDIYLCSSNCEEDMGETALAMVEIFKQKGIAPLFVLDEGGAVIDNPPLGVTRQFAAIGVAEKGIANAFVDVCSTGGHAATPSPKDASAKLVSGLTSMLKNPAAAQLSRPVEVMLKELGKYSSFGLRIVFGNLWLFRPLVLMILKGSSETAAMVRTTYALTELKGSDAVNVISRTARAGINIRIDPTESVSLAINRLRCYFDDYAAISLGEASEPSPISPYDDACFSYIKDVTHSVYPDAIIAPYIQSSATDARHFARICPNTYRFAGFLFKGDQRSRIHGKDENLDVDSFLKGVGFYIELIRNLDLLSDNQQRY